jgi:hypothetical protein
MSDHVLVERLAGLASRVDNLAHACVGEESRKLQEQQDRLAKLTLVAIARELDATNRKYKDAVASLTAAIEEIDEADERIENIARVVKLVSKALGAAESLLGKAVGV